ncbi:MAG TPA: hypothetical protein DCP31_08030 [Cyanobacteria bacterium UBA8543]|jgi:hypothetical protein|nr:hypothetical protein [Cyanobacteria bacterium UBA8543]
MPVANFGKAKIKDHVSNNIPGLLQTMADLFGVSLDLMVRACSGDPKAITELTDGRRLAEAYGENLPNVVQSALTIIKVTGDFNQAMAEIAKQTRVSGTQTLKAVYSATNDETRMRNEIVEMRDKQANEVTAETARHLRSRNLIAVEGSTAELMAIAEYQSNLLRVEDKIPLAQQRVDDAYNKAVNRALWAKGSDADISRIRKPNYEKNRYGIGGLVQGAWNGFKRTMGL